MVAQSIDQLKQDWTDKYVVVDGAQPELARFRDVVGQVKTVNMSGRALVEFLEYHVNIGWFDIDVDFLKIVDKPAPKPEKAEVKKAAKPAAKAPVGEAASAVAAKPKAPPAKAAGGKQSVADILAAARAGKSPTKPDAGETASAAVAPAAPKPSAKPVAKPAADKAAGPVDRSKMSVADMIAAAKAGSAAGSAPAAPSQEAPAVDASAAMNVDSSPQPAKVAPKPAAASDKLDKSKMSIDDMVAWCQDHDTK
jgi:hypothetical protein